MAYVEIESFQIITEFGTNLFMSQCKFHLCLEIPKLASAIEAATIKVV